MIKTIIFVEDGSVDIDDLKESVGEETLVVPYRQGAPLPHIEQPREPLDKTVVDILFKQHEARRDATCKALEKVLDTCKISKKVQKILGDLYGNYYS